MRQTNNASPIEPRPNADLIGVRFTVGSCRQAVETLANAFALVGLYRDGLTDGPERRAAERERERIMRLWRWMARLLEDE